MTANRCSQAGPGHAGRRAGTRVEVEVPGELVRYLVRGLVQELASVSQEIAELAEQHGARLGRKLYAEPLADFHAALMLLDGVEWSERTRRAPVAVDLSLAPAVVLRALESQRERLAERLREIPPAEGPLVRDSTLARAEAITALMQLAERRLRTIGISPSPPAAETDWIEPGGHGAP